MTLRSALLFDRQSGTYYLRTQWTKAGALQPIMAGFRLIDTEGLATSYLRGLAKAAFPSREPLPTSALSDADGKGTVAFWDWLVP